MGLIAESYHRKILVVAAEDNPNNSRVPNVPGKGYRECLERGWIVEARHAHGGYLYYTITERGEAALRAPRPKRQARPSRLKPMPDRLKPSPDRLGKPD